MRNSLIGHLYNSRASQRAQILQLQPRLDLPHTRLNSTSSAPYTRATMATAQATATSSKTHLTLKGSTAIVSDFFNFSVQSILYQRGIYPAEDFRPVKKYGLQMLITTDDGLETYIENCLKQVKEWIESGQLTRLVVAIVEKETQDTRERWQFDLEVTGSEEGTEGGAAGENAG